LGNFDITLCSSCLLLQYVCVGEYVYVCAKVHYPYIHINEMK